MCPIEFILSFLIALSLEELSTNYELIVFLILYHFYGILLSENLSDFLSELSEAVLISALCPGENITKSFRASIV